MIDWNKFLSLTPPEKRFSDFPQKQFIPTPQTADLVHFLTSFGSTEFSMLVFLICSVRKEEKLHCRNLI
jgi:hypothetical protein